MTTWEKMLREFENSKISEKVKFPQEGTQKGEVLKFYWENKGIVLTKKQIEKEVCERMGIATKDLQSVRHLGKQDGFNILQQGSVFQGTKLNRGCYVFLGFDNINNYYSLRRRDESDLDWTDIKERFDYRCATCGEKEGHTHRKTGEMTTLQKGHMDPSKEMDNSNIVPQCSYCNQLYGNRFVFDSVGNIKLPTTEGVLLMPESLKRQIFSELKKEFIMEDS